MQPSHRQASRTFARSRGRRYTRRATRLNRGSPPSTPARREKCPGAVVGEDRASWPGANAPFDHGATACSARCSREGRPCHRRRRRPAPVQYPVTPESRGRVGLASAPHGRARNPGVAARRVKSRGRGRGQRVIAARDQHFPGAQHRCGGVGAGDPARQDAARGPGSGGRSVEHRSRGHPVGRGRGVPSHGQHEPAARRQRCCMKGPLELHRSGGAPGTGAVRIKLARLRQHRSGEVTARDEDVIRRQERRGMTPARAAHRRHRRPRVAARRVTRRGRQVEAVREVLSAGHQDGAVAEQAGGVLFTVDARVGREAPEPASSVVDLAAATRDGAADHDQIAR